MPTFTTSFTPPSPPSGLLVEADLDLSAVLMSWDPTTIAQVDFGGYRVSRSLDGIVWELLAVKTDVNDVSYQDFHAPLNRSVAYAVTQANLDIASEPATASVDLTSLAWYFVVPGDEALTFPITRQQEGDLSSQKIQDVFVAMGRRGKIVVSDVVMAEDGSVSLLVRPDELATIDLFKQLQALSEGTILLKATDGSVWPVQPGDLRRRFTRGGMQELSISVYGTG